MRLMRRRAALLATPSPLLALTAACSAGASPSSAPTAASTARATTPAGAAAAATAARPELVHVFSNSSPHITEIDAATNKITRTKDVPNLGVWATNDDNCYFD